MSMVQRKQMKQRRAAQKASQLMTKQFQAKTQGRKLQLGILKKTPAPAPGPVFNKGRRALD